MGYLFKNRYWVIMLVVSLFVNISYGLSASGGTYYAKYILGNDNIVALLGAIGLIPTFLGFILVGPMTKKFGMAKTCLIGCSLGAAACVVRIFTPYSFYSCIIGGSFQTFATMPIMCVSAPMVNKAFGKWERKKRRKRQERKKGKKDGRRNKKQEQQINLRRKGSRQKEPASFFACSRQEGGSCSRHGTGPFPYIIYA